MRSRPTSKKGNALAAAFARHGRQLLQPDLNLPSFAELTYSGMLRAVFKTLNANINCAATIRTAENIRTR